MSMKTKIKYVFLVGLVLFAVYSIMPNKEVIETYYPSMHEVTKDKAQERGWIPDFLPKSSYDINEQHNLDTNTRIVEFSFLHKDKIELLNMEKRLIDIGSVNSLPVGWKLIWNEAELYRIDKPYEEGYLVVNWKQSRALYWSKHR